MTIILVLRTRGANRLRHGIVSALLPRRQCFAFETAPPNFVSGTRPGACLHTRGNKRLSGRVSRDVAAVFVDVASPAPRRAAPAPLFQHGHRSCKLQPAVEIPARRRRLAPSADHPLDARPQRAGPRRRRSRPASRKELLADEADPLLRRERHIGRKHRRPLGLERLGREHQLNRPLGRIVWRVPARRPQRVPGVVPRVALVTRDLEDLIDGEPEISVDLNRAARVAGDSARTRPTACRARTRASPARPAAARHARAYGACIRRRRLASRWPIDPATRCIARRTRCTDRRAALHVRSDRRSASGSR